MNIICSLTLSLLMLPWVDSPDVDYQIRVQVSTGLRALTTSDVVRPDVQHNDLLTKKRWMQIYILNKREHFNTQWLV